MNKKEIYAENGIEYKAGKIYNPLFGFVPEMLVDGNQKIGKGIFHFSTLPGTKLYSAIVNGDIVEVKGTCACDCGGCYAMTGNYRYQSVINALAMRTAIARYGLVWLKNAINAQIKADNIQAIRIHASGDFFSRDYVAMWQEIARENKNCKFWTYTKLASAENAFDGIDNANIVKSIIPGIGFNFGKAAYVTSAYHTLQAAGESVHICKCGIDKNQHCTSCKGCSENKFVLFLEHSTDYRPEKDSDFPAFVALVERQGNKA